MTRVVCPKDCIALVNKLLYQTKSYPKTAGIMLKQYRVTIGIEIYDPILKEWRR